VLAVRGEQYGSPNYIDNNDSTITDTATGLMWQKGTAPGLSWQQALSYCENLSLAGYTDWRLPNRNELQMLLDYSRSDPSIDTSFFPITESGFYLSSTTSPLNAMFAISVNFDCGEVQAPYDKSNILDVRAVRTRLCKTYGDCEGNFDRDQDVDGTDASTFKRDFGRSVLLRPCTTGDCCNGDFTCDSDVDGTDASKFKSDFGRSSIINPCPTCVAEDWCAYP